VSNNIIYFKIANYDIKNKTETKTKDNLDYNPYVIKADLVTKHKFKNKKSALRRFY